MQISSAQLATAPLTASRLDRNAASTPVAAASRPLTSSERMVSQLPEVADALDNRRDTVRQVAVGVMQMNSRQKMIDTYLQVSAESERSDARVTVADVVDAEASLSRRQLLIALLERAQNSEPEAPEVEPFVAAVDVKA